MIQNFKDDCNINYVYVRIIILPCSKVHPDLGFYYIFSIIASLFYLLVGTKEIPDSEYKSYSILLCIEQARVFKTSPTPSRVNMCLIQRP